MCVIEREIDRESEKENHNENGRAENVKHTSYARKHMESKLLTHHSAVHFQFQNPIARRHTDTQIHLRAQEEEVEK